jgi:gliding motility-associated-like protein
MLLKVHTLFFAFCFIFFAQVKATHNRAGEITYKRIQPFTKVVGGVTVQVYTYSITIITYTDDGPGIADRCVDTVLFGDGDRGIAPRINGPTNCANNNSCGFLNGKAVTCGSLIINDQNYKVKQNIYTIIHTYPGAGSYLIRTFDPNRNQGVRNIPNSVNLPFYIESLLIINSLTGANSSPIFAFPPVDRACVGVCFEHNPGAFDPDGDSLSYEISTSRGVNGQTVLGYFFPNAETPGATYGINAQTGLLKWCTPQFIDEYNIAFIVKEWRKNTSGNYQLIGYVLRDMQVIVNNCVINLPPAITVPADVCIEAGKTLTANLVVSDPNNGNLVTVQGGGGAFEAENPVASFNPTSGTANNSFNVFFSWNTTCNHIRSQPYLTTFKVEDNGSPVKLVSFNTFNIRVVPPSVKNVSATPSGSTMKISWTLSTCSPTSNPLTAYKIYRKQDCTPFNPDPCQTGVLASSGFSLIGQVSSTSSSFIDTNNGDGLVVGQDYSYVVVAVYKDGIQSYGSTQICAKLKRDVPVILNVDVNSTSATGIVWVRWTRPIANAANFDTLKIPGPYEFRLKHRPGLTGNLTTIQTFTSTFFAKLETEFFHNNINTITDTHEYLLEFVAGTVTIGSSQRASSIFLTTVPADRKVSLSWFSKTPWSNYTYSVMRKKTNTANFVLIGTTTLTSFVDVNNVLNDSTYCYYVIGEGKYSDPTIFSPLFNSSEISCAKAVDLTPPATPTLSIDADCPAGSVIVSWNDIRSIPESDDVFKYVLFYKPTVNGTYSEIATILSNEARFFLQDDVNRFSGCYAVQATDIHGNVGKLSQDFCIDNCPEFELPNIFSPNNDQSNDFYKAIKVRQIKEIDLAIVDRWGHVVYTTKDPYFKWDGVSKISNVQVSEGTFFYVCDVFESRLKGIVKRTLKGYLQVVR